MRTRTLLFALLAATAALAQAPERMTYQAVIRDASNALVANTAVGMQLSVLQGSSSGAAVYVETHAPVSNANGLVSVELGGGTVVSGSMSTIDWSAGPYFIKTETDPAGGSAYSITGTQQLLSVPYALYAANGGTVGPPGPQGPQGPPGVSGCEVVHTGDGRVVVYSATEAKGFGFNSTSGSGWYTTSISGTILGVIASDSSVVIYTGTNAYGFGYNSTSGSGWYTTSLAAPPTGAVATTGRIVLYSATEAKGFGYNSTSGSSWYVTTLASAPLDQVVGGNRIVLYSATEAKGFGYNSTSGSGWYTTSLSAAPVDHLGTR